LAAVSVVLSIVFVTASFVRAAVSAVLSTVLVPAFPVWAVALPDETCEKECRGLLCILAGGLGLTLERLECNCTMRQLSNLAWSTLCIDDKAPYLMRCACYTPFI
jgi:hypothetical protein